MSNILILVEEAIGDTIVKTILIINHNKKNVIDLLLPKESDRTTKIKQLIEKIPYVNSIFEFNKFDERTLLNYDLIYIPKDQVARHYNFFPTIKFLKNVIMIRKFSKNNLPTHDLICYTPEAIAKLLNIDNYNIKISIDWYNEFYKNYNFSKKSLLLNTKSTSMNRNYYHKMELKQELTNCGFNVIEINNDKNICENLHVLNQVKYIITVDTGVFWLAKSLGKKPFMIIPEHNYDNRFVIEKSREAKVLNGKTVKEIVEDFLCSINYLNL